ncbi:MAG TPA: hypothetical protein VLL77_07440 [Anaerolineales bacterium]|nr:hypothetical protein [Anaerolineales bacterium]
MGRDSWRARQHEIEREKKKRINPIWRGVGCLLMVILAMGGYLFSNWFIVQNDYYQWLYLPQEVVRPSFAPWLPPGILINLSVAVLFLIFTYLTISIVYAIAFPIKPGEYDLPTPRRERRRRP